MTDMVYVPDLMEANGKTIRENNMATKHKLSVGEAVRFTSGEDFCERLCQNDSKAIQNAVSSGILYVASIDRDCDGTPLYTLTLEKIDDLKANERIYDYYCRKINPDYKNSIEDYIETSNLAGERFIDGIAEEEVQKA